MSNDLQTSYDLVAEQYGSEFRDEMDKKPFDRKMLDWLTEKVNNSGIICDMGCGPGQIAGYLYKQGVNVCGIDLSPEMVKQAQKLFPDISFSAGDMNSLSNIAENSFGGIAAFYSIVHLERASLLQVFKEFQRVLKPNGKILLAFHIGKEIKHLDEWWGKDVSLDFYFFETDEIKDYLNKAGFKLEEVIERDPYPEVEYQSRRAYIFARKITIE